MEAKYKVGDWIKSFKHEGEILHMYFNEVSSEWVYICDNPEKKYKVAIKESNIKKK